jgi:hypothetical protein
LPLPRLNHGASAAAPCFRQPSPCARILPRSPQRHRPTSPAKLPRLQSFSRRAPQLAGRDLAEVFPMAGSLLNPSRGLVRNSTFHGRCVALLVLAQLNAILRSVLSDVELSSVSVSLRTSSSLPRAELSVGLQLAMVSNSCTNRDLRLVFPAALTCVDLCSLRSGCRAGSLHTWCTPSWASRCCAPCVTSHPHHGQQLQKYGRLSLFPIFHAHLGLHPQSLPEIWLNGRTRRSPEFYG